MRRLKRAPKIAGVPVTPQTAKDLMKAARDVVLRNQATPEKAEERMKICLECPAWTGSRCRECGCFMKTKTTLKNSKCPLGKWD
tara:strand:- start:228 stop:479 length:252 start_codon:yes stop_codon:yes gene_type:complete